MDESVRFRRHDRAVAAHRDPAPDLSDKLVDWGRFALRIAILPGVIWLINLERRVSVMEASSNTVNTAIAAATAHSDIYLAIADKADRDEVPGDDILRRVGELERRVSDIERGRR